MRRKCKREWINEQIQQIEENSNPKNTRELYERIREQSRIYEHKTCGVKKIGKGRAI